MAYLYPLPKCKTCRTKPATCELRNRVNATIGKFCDRCGKKALATYIAEVEEA